MSNCERTFNFGEYILSNEKFSNSGKKSSK